MSAASIDVTIEEPARGHLGKRWVRDVVSTTLKAMQAEEDAGGRPFQVSIVVTNDETLQDLNRHYRGEDEVTDVLSFSPTQGAQWLGEEAEAPQSVEVEFVLPPNEPKSLGEIIISYPQALRQASTDGGKKRRVKEEMALLIAHGVLHLLGYDHSKPHEEVVMRTKEREILAAIL